MHQGVKKTTQNPKIINQLSDVNLSLRKAAANGDLKSVTKLLGQADINSSGAQSKKTALHRAAENGHQDVVRFLVENNADINLRDVNGNPPVFLSLMSKFPKIAEYLINQGAKIAQPNIQGYQALMFVKNDWEGLGSIFELVKAVSARQFGEELEDGIHFRINENGSFTRFNMFDLMRQMDIDQLNDNVVKVGVTNRKYNK